MSDLFDLEKEPPAARIPVTPPPCDCCAEPLECVHDPVIEYEGEDVQREQVPITEVIERAEQLAKHARRVVEFFGRAVLAHSPGAKLLMELNDQAEWWK